MIDELLALEHRGWAALCDRTGADFYGQLMIDDAVMVLAHGQALDRQAVVDALTDAPPWTTYEIIDPRLIELDGDHAAVVYTARARRDDEPAFVALMSSLYTRRNGEWRLALYQQTVVPQT